MITAFCLHPSFCLKGKTFYGSLVVSPLLRAGSMLENNLHWELFLVSVNKRIQHVCETALEKLEVKKTAGTSIHPHITNLRKAEMIEVGK